MTFFENKAYGNLVIFAFILYELFFLWRGIKNSENFKQKPLMEAEGECLMHLILGPWRTPYCIGGLVQLFLLFLVTKFQL